MSESSEKEKKIDALELPIISNFYTKIVLKDGTLTRIWFFVSSY